MKASKYKQRSDSELVSLCIGGDAAAWEALILRYRRLIYSITVRFGLPRHDAADAFQAVCLKLIEHLPRLKDETKVSAWLITTTTRQCLEWRAQVNREADQREPGENKDEEFEEPLDPADSLEDIRLQVEKQQAIREAVGELPEKCRILLEMLYFDTVPHSYEEVGAKLSMPEASVGPNRLRCMERLRVILRRRGIK